MRVMGRPFVVFALLIAWVRQNDKRRRGALPPGCASPRDIFAKVKAGTRFSFILLQIPRWFGGRAPIDLWPGRGVWQGRAEDRMTAAAHSSALADSWAAEESPDSMKQRCRVTPGGGNPRESATEKSLPRLRGEGETVG